MSVTMGTCVPQIPSPPSRLVKASFSNWAVPSLQMRLQRKFSALIYFPIPFLGRKMRTDAPIIDGSDSSFVSSFEECRLLYHEDSEK
ncbi:hypothetical protein NPIL_696201 [Nephila pilipes]|uniref:Uncharacterized protein n=1 Tax=Nephila pilipes TaxID=299642 RepID=A0A8X6IU55_NEPPI|nr:hypothetical protein NPIL_696201 [Nephila pilipes]